MNKMLRALKKLQAPAVEHEGFARRDVSSPATPAQATSPAAVATVKPEPEAPKVVPKTPRKPAAKFDVNEWMAGPKQPAYVMREVARTIPSVGKIVAEPETEQEPSPELEPEPDQPPKLKQRPVGVESHWERAARNELSSPAGFDAYRAIGQQIRRDLPGTSPRGIMLAGIGCDTNDVAETALRIAILFAVDGRETALVDAELNHPLTDALVSGNPPGLSEALLENVPIKHFLAPTGTTGLRFCPAGAAVRNVSHASFAQLPTADIVEQLRVESSLVIVSAGDAAQPSAQAWGRSCDAAYLLVRLGITTAQQAYAARMALQECGARLLGCIAIDGHQ